VCGVCGWWCGVLCGLLYGVVWHLVFCVCLHVCGVCVCAHVVVYLYIHVLTQIQREGVCEIFRKWNLDMAKNYHLKTSTLPRISFLIYSSISNSSSSTAL